MERPDILKNPAVSSHLSLMVSPHSSAGHLRQEFQWTDADGRCRQRQRKCSRDVAAVQQMGLFVLYIKWVKMEGWIGRILRHTYGLTGLAS